MNALDEDESVSSNVQKHKRHAASKVGSDDQPHQIDDESTVVEWRDDAVAFAKALGTRIVEETRKHPKVYLGIALGVGFVLGGGLATRIGRLVLLGGVELALRNGAVNLRGFNIPS